MNHTGFYGQASGFESDKMAVGYGAKKLEILIFLLTGDPLPGWLWAVVGWFRIRGICIGG